MDTSTLTVTSSTVAPAVSAAPRTVTLNEKVGQLVVGEDGRAATLQSRVKRVAESVGKRAKATAIRAGMSLNRRNYRETALRSGVNLFGQVPVYANHPPRGETHDVRTIVGVFSKPSWNQETRTIQGELEVYESAEWLREVIRKNPSVIGLSIFAEASVTDGADDQGAFADVLELLRVHSLDVVDIPAAGGRIDQVLESVGNGPAAREGDTPMEKTLTESDVKLAAVESKQAAEAKLAEAVALHGREKATLEAKVVEQAAEIQNLKGQVTARTQEAEAAKRAKAVAESGQIVEKALADSGLPEAAQKRIRKAVADQIVTAESMAEIVEEQRGFIAELGVKPASPVHGAGAAPAAPPSGAPVKEGVEFGKLMAQRIFGGFGFEKDKN